MNPQKNDARAHQTPGRPGTPPPGAKDSVWGESGHPGWTQPCLVRTGSLKRGLASDVASETRNKNASGPSLRTGSSEGLTRSRANRSRFLKRRVVRASRHQQLPHAREPERNGVKRHEGSVRCEHSRFPVLLGAAPKACEHSSSCLAGNSARLRRHSKNTRLPDPSDVRKARR